MKSNLKSPELIKDLGMLFPKETSTTKRRYGLYLCHCGKEYKTQIYFVNHGMSKGCGCYIKHGLKNHILYSVWSDMMGRINRVKNIAYHNYGGRGISVCERWKDISNFIEDMYPSYEEGLSIDRIDVDGNYEPNNCRWANRNTQARNTRVLMSTNTSGYRGVTFNKNAQKWRAQIVVDRSKVYLGSYNTPIDAAIAYNKFILENKLEHTINTIGEVKDDNSKEGLGLFG